MDAFIRKYYANKLLRGIIIFLASALAFYLIISLGEYFFYFPSWLRYSFLGIFAILGVGSLAIWVINPLLKMSRLGKVISHHQAAQIIGDHFPNVKDKLLNILQLSHQSENAKSKELILASIEQKTQELSPIPFTNAVNLGANKKFLPYLLIPLFIGIFILFAAPSIFKDSAQRLFQPEKSFAPQAPFTFEWTNKTEAVPQYEDVEIKVKTKGKTVPESISIILNGQKIAMQKNSDGSFSHTIHKLSKETLFQFEANGFLSKENTIKVWPNPLIKDFSVNLNYPSYTGKKDETLSNIGDVVVPEGTVITWNFTTEHTDKMLFGFTKVPTQPLTKNGNRFSISKRFFRDTSYSISLSNKSVKGKNDLQYHVSVIPDQYPSIHVNQYNDSLTENFVLFVGDAGDDYGISTVALQYSIQGEKGRKKNGRVPMNIKAGTFTQFEYFMDIEELGMQPGDELQYYFNACDNDGVNGSKCAKSAIFTYAKPSLKQLDSIVDQTQKEINKDLKNTAKQNEKVDKDIDKLKQKLLEKKNLDWQDKKKLQDLVKKNEAIQKQIESIKNKFQKNIKQSEEKNHSEDIKQKQKSLENLLEDLKDNKLAEKMKKIEELMKMLNKDKLFEELQKTQEENMQMEKDLDRMLELMKQLERDMRMEDVANKAKDLAKKEEELNKETDANKKGNDELKKKQDELNKKMDKLKKDLEELNKINKETETPQKMGEVNKQQKDAESQMDESSDALSKPSKASKSKASKAQKKAQKNLEDMANSLKSMAGGGSADQTEIDIKATRQILSNLLRMSFDQESLIAQVKSTNVTDPTFVTNVQQQYKLKDDSKMIADSLFALSKRLFEISSFVNKETGKINSQMKSSIQYLEARNKRRASVNQQYVMTSTNNLALMLNELLDQLQKKQAKQQGSGSCSKPGNKPGSKPGNKPGKKGGKGMGMQLSDIISKQEQLGSAMKRMLDKQGKKNPGKQGSEKGGKDGDKKGEAGKKGEGKKPGKEGGKSDQSGGESEEIARMAAQQSMLRKQLDDINNSLIKNGKSNPELTKIKNEMDRIETELVNKRITNNLLSRQSLILSRLMKAKNAIREQDQGEERESQSGKEVTREIPQNLKDILKNKKAAVEYYKTVPASLQPYYKNLVEQYFDLIK